MKHTKGEWSYQVWEPESDPQCTVYSDVAGRTKIADVGFFKHTLATQEEAEANAKLIASAPDLLEEHKATYEGLKLILPKVPSDIKDWIVTKIIVLENLIIKATA